MLACLKEKNGKHVVALGKRVGTLIQERCKQNCRSCIFEKVEFQPFKKKPSSTKVIILTSSLPHQKDKGIGYAIVEKLASTPFIMALFYECDNEEVTDGKKHVLPTNAMNALTACQKRVECLFPPIILEYNYTEIDID